jgi:hypothetical protein
MRHFHRYRRWDRLSRRLLGVLARLARRQFAREQQQRRAEQLAWMPRFGLKVWGTPAVMVFDLAVEVVEQLAGGGRWRIAATGIVDGLEQRLAKQWPIPPDDGIEIA